MIFEYKCDCGYENSFYFVSERISDFICNGCKKYIGSSNNMYIEFFKPIYKNNSCRIITNYLTDLYNYTNIFDTTQTTYNISCYYPSNGRSSV